MKSTNQLKAITIDKNFIAYCGLYCGACPSYLKGRCPGCKDNVKAAWCSVRKCCMENNYLSCADCKSVELSECKKYNTFISKVIGYVLNSDRSACISRIKELGYNDFAMEMANNKMQTIKRK
jgi:hypothetical protein